MVEIGRSGASAPSGHSAEPEPCSTVSAVPASVLNAITEMQAGFHNEIHRVALRAGFLLCREYMARFVEATDSVIANSIRLNWIPSLGDDPGPPRQLLFDECVAAEDMENGPWEAKDPGVGPEAAVYALSVMAEFGMELPTQARASNPTPPSDGDEK